MKKLEFVEQSEESGGYVSLIYGDGISITDKNGKFLCCAGWEKVDNLSKIKKALIASIEKTMEKK